MTFLMRHWKHKNQPFFCQMRGTKSHKMGVMGFPLTFTKWEENRFLPSCDFRFLFTKWEENPLLPSCDFRFLSFDRIFFVKLEEEKNRSNKIEGKEITAQFFHRCFLMSYQECSIFSSVTPEPTFWRAEPSFLAGELSRASTLQKTSLIRAYFFIMNMYHS